MELVVIIAIVVALVYQVFLSKPGECYYCGNRFSDHGGHYMRNVWRRPGEREIHHCCNCWKELPTWSPK